ncbi:MAG: hypothetical protein PUC65_06590 [Clostridiales bacterium]|nr:hypothetical protein [Clostridiales bacterium]
MNRGIKNSIKDSSSSSTFFVIGYLIYFFTNYYRIPDNEPMTVKKPVTKHEHLAKTLY